MSPQPVSQLDSHKDLESCYYSTSCTCRPCRQALDLISPKTIPPGKNLPVTTTKRISDETELSAPPTPKKYKQFDNGGLETHRTKAGKTTGKPSCDFPQEAMENLTDTSSLGCSSCSDCECILGSCLFCSGSEWSDGESKANESLQLTEHALSAASKLEYPDSIGPRSPIPFDDGGSINSMMDIDLADVDVVITVSSSSSGSSSRTVSPSKTPKHSNDGAGREEGIESERGNRAEWDAIDILLAGLRR